MSDVKHSQEYNVPVAGSGITSSITSSITWYAGSKNVRLWVHEYNPFGSSSHYIGLRLPPEEIKAFARRIVEITEQAQADQQTYEDNGGIPVRRRWVPHTSWFPFIMAMLFAFTLGVIVGTL